MKRFMTLTFLCSISLFGRAQTVASGYEINGNVKNIPAKRVYLKVGKRDPNTQQPYWPAIDSARIVDGKFTLHRDTILDDPAWASAIVYLDSNTKKSTSLSFINPKTSSEKNQRYGNFILENTRITMNGDLCIDKGITISGSKETDYQMKYGLLWAPSLSTIDRKIDSLQKLGLSDQLAASRTERSEMLRKFKNEFRQMVIQNASVWGALQNVYQNATVLSPGELEELAALFDKDLMKGPMGKKLNTYIRQSKLLLTDRSFPDFSYTTQDNKKLSLNQIKGKKGTLIVFWASWCGPCRAEIPELKTFYKDYNDKGIALLSISIDHNMAEWKKALYKEKMPWPNLSNLPGSHKEITSKYNVNAIPAMFLLDKDNKIVLADPNNFKLVKQKSDELIKNIN